MSDHKVMSIVLVNEMTEQRTLIVEPWAEEVPFPHGERIRVVSEGIQKSDLEIEIGETAIVVYGCSGCDLKIIANDEIIWRSYEDLR